MIRGKTIRELWGRDFEVVKEGLDESQVETFVGELVAERDTLQQRQEHLISLTRLAERAVAEADKLAEEIKSEAAEEGRARAATLLAKAEQEAQEIGEQKRAEILAVASKEAAGIRASAQREVVLLVGQYKERTQGQIKEMVRRLHDQLVSGLQGVTQQAIALRPEWESTLTVPVADNLQLTDVELQSASAPIADSVPPADSELPSASEPVTNSLPPADSELPSALEPVAGEQGETAGPEADIEYRQQVLEQLQEALADTDAGLSPDEQLLSIESLMAQQTDMQTEGKAEEVSAKDGTQTTYEGTVELNILPPLVPGQLVEIQRYLRDWPGIGITELKPDNNGYSITLSVDKPTQLVDILKQLPSVEDARECATDGAEVVVGGAPSQDGRKRIAVTVCVST
ncbi:hypothetical protein ACFLYR_02840 [Chloroflexota bacterium]